MTAGASIGVVICTYNNAAILDQALRHLAAQVGADAVPWDILVVDNNCTDRTRDVVESWTSAMPVTLRVIPEPQQGLNPARVTGARRSTGDWIAYVDDDCLLAPDWIRQAAAFIAEHPQAGAFGGQVILQWEDGPMAEHVDGYGYAFAETRLGDRALVRGWLAGAGMVLRRDALVATGWLDGQYLEDRVGGRLVSGGDVELGLRIARSFEIWYAPLCVLHHSIPRRRTERRYLRRLVFGLGWSSHDVAVLQWTAGTAPWWRHALGRAAALARQGTSRAVRDLRHARHAYDARLSLAFASGWLCAMAAFVRSGTRARRARMGRLAASVRSDPRD